MTVDVIVVTAIVAAMLVGAVWAAPVIVLILTTGEALESYAANIDDVVPPDDIARVADAVAIGHSTVDIALQAIWIDIGLSLMPIWQRSGLCRRSSALGSEHECRDPVGAPRDSKPVSPWIPVDSAHRGRFRHRRRTHIS